VDYPISIGAIASYRPYTSDPHKGDQNLGYTGCEDESLMGEMYRRGLGG